jgi:hypothetical protein
VRRRTRRMSRPSAAVAADDARYGPPAPIDLAARSRPRHSPLKPQFLTTPHRTVGAAVCGGEPAACRIPRPHVAADDARYWPPASVDVAVAFSYGAKGSIGEVDSRRRRVSVSTTRRIPQRRAGQAPPLRPGEHHRDMVLRRRICRSRRRGATGRGGRGAPSVVGRSRGRGTRHAAGPPAANPRPYGAGGTTGSGLTNSFRSS